MTVTLQSVAANLIEKIADDLIHIAKATPEDRANWQPAEGARTVLHQLVECCLANAMWTNTLQNHMHAMLPDGVAEQAYRELDTIDKVTVRLRETSARLAAVIRTLPDSDMDVIVPFPWKPEQGRSIAECCYHPYWNMCYHHGQIAYVQTMYGDQEEHGDIGPFGEIDCA
jgi:uncharacterized damage-inducible protein DinB